jgi:hypothetical protein
MRVVQPVGTKGSLKWIQRAIAERWPDLEEPIRAQIGLGCRIDWVSPLAQDEFAEYRDAAFLARLGLGHLAGDLARFWPARGPQWDALGRSDAGHVLLVEAKAHIGEFCSPASAAGDASLGLIRRSLAWAGEWIGADPAASAMWHRQFYQYANRLAHLVWLREQDIDARLVLVGFVNDGDMLGRTTPEAWEAAYQVANFAMGIRGSRALARHVIHVMPDVSARQQPAA